MSATFSVVIPAHNEAATIGRCLEGLTGLAAGGAEVVVVVNGSTDGTAAVAASYPGVDVVELPEPGKANALNEGDSVATRFPRIYLDADIRVAAEGLSELAGVLSGTPSPLAAGLTLHIDDSASSALVRRFYDVFRRMPYAGDGLIGLGIYGLNEAGRGRFGRFPDLTGDDLFVQRCFSPDERVVVGAPFTVTAPRDLRSLLAVRTRVAFGNLEAARSAPAVDLGATTVSSMRSVADQVRRREIPVASAAVYVGVTVAARLRALVRLRRGVRRWDSDRSTR